MHVVVIVPDTHAHRGKLPARTIIMAEDSESWWSLPTSPELQDQTQALCQELVQHLTRIMDPLSSQELRNACTEVSSN